VPIVIKMYYYNDGYCSIRMEVGCAMPIPLHLCFKVVFNDPKITSLGSRKQKYLKKVEQVIRGEKYE
jgi:hypothetical protein